MGFILNCFLFFFFGRGVGVGVGGGGVTGFMIFLSLRMNGTRVFIVTKTLIVAST